MPSLHSKIHGVGVLWLGNYLNLQFAIKFELN
jgi:hypothetical protein